MVSVEKSLKVKLSAMLSLQIECLLPITISGEGRSSQTTRVSSVQYVLHSDVRAV